MIAVSFGVAAFCIGTGAYIIKDAPIFGVIDLFFGGLNLGTAVIALASGGGV